MILRDEVLMNRDVEFPLPQDLEANLTKLLAQLNQFRNIYGKPMIVSSGYRPGHYNSDAGGAPDSPHKSCEACDFHDSDHSLKDWIAQNLSILDICNLYMEDPAHTPTWVHLQIRPVASGNRVFIP